MSSCRRSGCGGTSRGERLGREAIGTAAVRAGIQPLSRAVGLNPHFALGHAGLGYGLAVGGELDLGLESLELALRPSPRDPFLAIYAPVVRYMALFALQRYEEALDTVAVALRDLPAGLNCSLPHDATV